MGAADRLTRRPLQRDNVLLALTGHHGLGLVGADVLLRNVAASCGRERFGRMHSVLITLAIVAVIALIHFSYVDFRFRHRDGILWYWLLNPAPRLMWVSRAAIIGAFIVAVSVKFIGTSLTLAVVLVGLVALHIVSLIIVEAREHRGRP
jgi:hypothetical protein